MTMRCHYDVLEIPRDADETAIKAAYKKMALRCHPDKNLDRIEDAKEQFQLVQQAYEVLTDRHERAWYDSHREQILRRSDSARKETDVNLVDVFPYFTSACFCGYGDDEGGFYAVYSQLFSSIAKEDLANIDDIEEFQNIPEFGASRCDYDEIVHPFYSYWMAYNTTVTYSWLDERIPKDIRDRRVFKLIEKENKKIRTKAKKERNEEIRNLVQFVRKRDKRVQANIKRLQDRAEENRKKQEQISRERRSEQRKSNMAEAQAEWTKFDNVKAQLEEIERHLGLSTSSDDGDDDTVRDDDPFLCVACNKLFKTQKAFENHEKSKKHKENVDLLRDVFQKEDKSLKNGFAEHNDDLSSGPTSKTAILSQCSSTEDLEDKDAVQEAGTSSTELEYNRIRNKKKTKKNNKVLSSLVVDHLEDPSELDNLAANKKAFNSTEIIDVIPEDRTNISKQLNKDKVKKKRRKDKNEGVLSRAVEGNLLECPSHICVTCKNTYTSNNKLYVHLKKSGHAAPVT